MRFACMHPSIWSIGVFPFEHDLEQETTHQDIDDNLKSLFENEQLIPLPSVKKSFF